MQSPLAGILALLIGMAGWYYLFYSQAAVRLASVEHGHANRRRGLLRRWGGVSMLLLAVMFYAGFRAVDPEAAPVAFLLVWLSVILLLGVLVVLSLVDVRLTRQLRRERKGAGIE